MDAPESGREDQIRDGGKERWDSTWKSTGHVCPGRNART
jgi:hypothetical protein